MLVHVDVTWRSPPIFTVTTSLIYGSTFILEGKDEVLQANKSGLEVIKLQFILKLKIKRNEWLLACHFEVCKNVFSCYILALIPAMGLE